MLLFVNTCAIKLIYISIKDGKGFRGTPKVLKLCANKIHFQKYRNDYIIIYSNNVIWYDIKS